MAIAGPIDIALLEEECISICQEMIRIPSVNFGDGVGDERSMADYVAKKLAEVGIDSELIVTGENRVNVVAKIVGVDQDRPGLVVHGHLDVVPASADDWTLDPFGGEIKDGYLWGRGAVDMKDMDAMILATVRAWKRSNYQPPRNILLVFFADEEAGSEYGSRYLVKNRPEIFEGYSEAISEVGGFSVTITGGHRLYFIESAQKGINWLQLKASGEAGHGSFINPKNSISKLAAAVARIGSYEWPQVETKTGRKFWSKIAELTGEKYDPANVRPLLKHIGGAARMMGATIQNTSNPTMLNAGYKANVIPQHATAVVDGRFLPGFEDDLINTVKKLAGDEIEVEVLVRDKALEVDFEGPLVDAMKAAIAKYDPEGIPVPYLMSGGTDNKALSDLGIIGYGFSPVRLPSDLDFFALFHGVDERIPIDGLRFGVKVLNEFLQNS
ncbi:MAG: M20/M25/M40 family metallo-hydrolase [Actinobacteria bacterium]|nr:M20/M25/M40 family metallo-hydrolase [Actinomycetota bacterium]MSW21961.1 M20/M25/M40 family metallo-hydrolase [Actinomycetota bacterium]MSX03518.1 M20/M25/M40 family metallo-hydrolase [Actinomycetota bacterium]MSX61118.1 M20/M25/M40 family metallo-hydrolase [Actinomycetota bacterium]MSX83534.1 M20/M25/M40 family metallo-hydrolase [Actinomycetota bacterium]